MGLVNATMNSSNHLFRALILTLLFFLFASGATNCSSRLSNTTGAPTPITPSPAPPSVQTTSSAIFTPPVTATLYSTPAPLAQPDFRFSAGVEDPQLAEAIQITLQEKTGLAVFGGRPFCSYALLMPLQTTMDGKTQAYLQVLCIEFYLKDGALLQGTGISIPAALSLSRQNDGWHVVEYRRPQTGNWGESLREIFPPEALDLLIMSTPDEILRHNAVVDMLFQKNLRQALDFYGMPFMPTPGS